jgi:hypothetical protein
MKRYKENKKTKFFKFMIVVPTQKDKDELIKAFRYIHNLGHLDTDFVIVNQLAHLYLDEPANPVTIVVDNTAFEQLCNNNINEF